MSDENKAKTRDGIAEEYYKKNGWVPTESAVMNFFAGFDAAIKHVTDQNPPPEVQGLIEALEFYADENNYNHFPATGHPDCTDFVGFVEEKAPGDKAREALTELRKWKDGLI